MLKKKQRGKTVIHQAHLHKKNEKAITPRSSHCACERLTVAFKWNEQNQLLLYLHARISCWQCQICSAEMTDEDVWKEFHIYRTRWKLNWCYKLNSVFNNIFVFCYCIIFCIIDRCNLCRALGTCIFFYSRFWSFSHVVCLMRGTFLMSSTLLRMHSIKQ